MLSEEKYEELRSQHGDVRRVDFVDDDGQTLSIVLRKPVADMHDAARDEYLAFLTQRFALEQGRGEVPDPQKDGTAELLRCVVYPEPGVVRNHLHDYPGDAGQLRRALYDLAGRDAVDEDKSLVGDEVRAKFHRRAVGFRVAGKTLIARPMSQAEHATYVSKNGGTTYPIRAEAATWVAWSCAQELPDKVSKRKAGFEELLSEVPHMGVSVGAILIGKALSRVVDREKK